MVKSMYETQCKKSIEYKSILGKLHQNIWAREPIY